MTAPRGRALLGILALLLAMGAFWAVPVVTPQTPRSTVVLDARGALLGARVARDQQWRFGPGATVPDRYVLALLEFEDQRFWWHPGVDPLAVVRALGSNLASGSRRRGASTLTMQLVRIARGDPPRTWGHKALEAVLAVRMEASLSKREILELYAANAPFGGNTVGLEAAAWRYFGRSPQDLTWAEAATLAVLPNRPSLVHPGRNRDALRERRDSLLGLSLIHI